MCIGSYADISIYVPTRGAIYIYAHHLNSTLISIHAPTRGATTTNAKRETENAFQSTLPREERHYLTKCVKVFQKFQSTLPREERLSRLSIRVSRHLFQSTLPREEQHMNQMHIPIIHNFNPHSHERSDFVPRRISRYIVISIHAPTRGATQLLTKHLHML